MNARGETVGRLSLPLLAAALSNVLVEEPTPEQILAIAAIFWLGAIFAWGSSISKWIEEKSNEDRDTVRRDRGQ